MTTYEIQDHDTNQTFTAETLTEITAHYWHTFAQENALTDDMKDVLNRLERGSWDNFELYTYLGIHVHTAN